MASRPTAMEHRLSRELRATRRLMARVGATALLFLGTATAIGSKVAYSLRASAGPDVPPRAFRKPLFMTFASFVAMAACLLLQAWQGRAIPRRHRAETRPPRARDAPVGEDSLREALLDATRDDDAGASARFPSPPPPSRRRQPPSRGPTLRARASLCLRLLPITLADLLATALMSGALLDLPLSVFLALRHGQLLFAAAIAVGLRRDLNPLHKLGVSLSLSGASLVALAAVLAAPELRSQTLVGVGLVALSQFVQAVQLTFEGYLLVDAARDAHASPMTLIGLEGAIGIIVMLFVVFPLAQTPMFPAGSGPGSGPDASYLPLEDSLETLEMLSRAPALAAFAAAYAGALAAYNYVGMSVSPAVGVATRTALETTRTLLCWGLGVAVGTGPASPLGETFGAEFSSMQLAGFVMGTLGTLLYGRGDAAERQRVFERERERERRERRRRRGSGTGGGERRTGRRRSRRRREGGDDDGDEGNADAMTRGRNDGGEGATNDGTVSVSAGAVAARVAGGSGSSEAFGSPVAHGAPLRDEAAAAEEGNERGREPSLEREPSPPPAADPSRLRAPFTIGSLKSSMSYASYGGVIPPGHASVASPPPGRVVTGFDVRGDDSDLERGRSLSPEP